MDDMPLAMALAPLAGAVPARCEAAAASHVRSGRRGRVAAGKPCARPARRGMTRSRALRRRTCSGRVATAARVRQQAWMHCADPTVRGAAQRTPTHRASGGVPCGKRGGRVARLEYQRLRLGAIQVWIREWVSLHGSIASNLHESGVSRPARWRRGARTGGCRKHACATGRPLGREGRGGKRRGRDRAASAERRRLTRGCQGAWRCAAARSAHDAPGTIPRALAARVR